IAIKDAAGDALIGVSGNVGNLTIANNILWNNQINTYGINMTFNVNGVAPDRFTVTGNTLIGSGDANSIGIQVPVVAETRGIVAGNTVTAFGHPFAGTSALFTTGPTVPGELGNFGRVGSVVYCTGCGVVSGSDNTCTTG